MATFLDIAILLGFFAVCALLVAFIKDDIATPDVPMPRQYVEADIAEDDDLDLSWSKGVGDHR
jgi:hypothetical protein